eukprot:623212_1
MVLTDIINAYTRQAGFIPLPVITNIIHDWTTEIYPDCSPSIPHYITIGNPVIHQDITAQVQEFEHDNQVQILWELLEYKDPLFCIYFPQFGSERACLHLVISIEVSDFICDRCTCYSCTRDRTVTHLPNTNTTNTPNPNQTNNDHEDKKNIFQILGGWTQRLANLGYNISSIYDFASICK